MSASLPKRPSLEWLRKAAKDRLLQLRATTPGAKLADAQLAVAREHGFSSWRRLKAHVEQQAAHHDHTDDHSAARFLECVGTGRIDAVREMLRSSLALVNAVGPHPFWGGFPQPLHVSIEARRRDMFDLLLEQGADVNGVNDRYDHWSPLMLAVHRDQHEMVAVLLRRGARVGLCEALMLRDDARVEALLRPGALPETVPNGGSILAFARTPFAIDRLVALGAPTDRKDRWGSTPIDAMSRLGPRGVALVRHLIGHGVAASPADYARLDDRDALARLFERDPALVRTGSVIIAAADAGHHQLVEWLLQRGANVNARADADSGHTALHAAAWNGDLDMVRLLVSAGADLAARDARYDATPLGWAETSIEVSNNPKCANVVAYLAAPSDR